MTETAEVTLPDGRTATVSGPTREAVLARVDTLRQGAVEEEPSSARPHREKLLYDVATAVPDLITTAATAGLGEIFGGASSALALLAGGALGADDEVQQARDVGEGISGFITLGPFSDAGKKTLNSVAPALVKLETKSDILFERMSDGFGDGINAPVATALKTAFWGGLEILPAGKGTITAIKLNRQLAKQKKLLEKMADKDGIVLHSDEFSASIVEAAKKMSPVEKAQNAPLLQEAIRLADADAKKAKDAAFAAAKKRRLFIETNSVRKLSDHLMAELIEDGFDVDNMKAVKGILDNMQSKKLGFGKPKKVPGVKRHATNFDQLEIIRRRANKKILGTKKSKQSDLALRRIIKGIDDMTTSRFNDIAIAGDKGAIDAWKAARAANTNYMKRFKADKVIVDLISKEASPEDIRKWVVGSSKMNAKQGAAVVLNKLKKELGDNHPAIEGIKQDYIFELVAPLMKDKPDFSTFARQYDEMIRNNPSVVKALGLDKTALDDLKIYSLVQKDLPPGGVVFSKMDISNSIARLSVGHQIAKAAVRVLFVRRLMNAAFSVDQVVSKQAILQELIDVRFGAPVVPKASPLAAQFVAGAALTGIQEED